MILTNNNPMMGPYRISSFQEEDVQQPKEIRTEHRRFSSCSRHSNFCLISQNSFSSTAASTTDSILTPHCLRKTINPTIPTHHPVGNPATLSHHVLNSTIRPEQIDLLRCSGFHEQPNHTATTPTFSKRNQTISSQSYTIKSVTSYILDHARSPVAKVEAACFYNPQGRLCKIQSKTWPVTFTNRSMGTGSYSFNDSYFTLKEFKEDKQIENILKQHHQEPPAKERTTQAKVGTSNTQRPNAAIKTPLDYFGIDSERYACEMIGSPKIIHYTMTGKEPIRNCKSSNWKILDFATGKTAEVELVLKYNEKSKKNNLVYCNLNTDLINPLNDGVKINPNLNPFTYLGLKPVGIIAHALHAPQRILFNANQAYQFDWDIKNSQQQSTGNIKMIFGLDRQNNQIKLLKGCYEGDYWHDNFPRN